MKTLMFDFEDGSKTLGSPEHIKDMFNYPVLNPSSFKDFKNIINQLYVVKKVTKDVFIGDLKVSQNEIQTVSKEGAHVDCVILDTFSELSKKYQRSLLSKEGRMKMQDWGKLKNTLDVLLEFITRIPGILIVNVHAKIKDTNDGTSKLLPYIDGSTKEDISKWFDFVFYTKAIDKPNGQSEYVWQTEHTEYYSHAKDRTQLLDKEIPQDFSIVFNAVKEKGFKSAKVLVIGEPGTGKTLALRTLVKNNKQTQGA